MKHKPFPAWIRNLGLKQGPGSLYLCLMSQRDINTGLAWPTVKSLSADTGMSKATIQRHLLTLISEGYIHLESGRAAGISNQYLLWEPNATFPDGSMMPVPKLFKGVPNE